jgi:hypothetical protein
MADVPAIERLRQANPVTDLADLVEERIDAHLFLTAIKQRSVEMKTDFERTAAEQDESETWTEVDVLGTDEPAGPPRTALLVGAAFALLVLVAGFLVLLNRDSESDVASDSVSTTAAGPAAAGSRVGGAVTFETLANIAIGDFTTTSDADICSEGTYATNFGTLIKTDTSWIFEDRFTCADESGSFIMRGDYGELDPANPNPITLDGAWTISGGTGQYTDLDGSGTFTSKTAPFWRDTYTGELHYGSASDG